MLHDEFALIKTIRNTLPRPSPRVLLGIGDDAAVVKSPAGKLVATADTLIEGVHFDLAYTTARELGHKALAVNLSDIAAMGATPLYALVSLGLKQELDERFVVALYQGIRALAKPYRLDVIGGNLVQSPSAIVVDITLLGQTKRYFTRAGARPGDLICVTGPLGTSTAGLQGIKRLGRRVLESDGYETLLEAHLRPTPRVKEALALKRLKAVTAMIDISDGLAKEIHHLATASSVGALVDESKLPLHPLSLRMASILGSDAKAWCLFGGEDYELLFTVKPSLLSLVRKTLKKSCLVIGEIRPRREGVQLQTEPGKKVRLEAKGWNHFVRRARPKHSQAFDIF